MVLKSAATLLAAYTLAGPVEATPQAAPEAIRTLVDRAVAMARRERGVDLCVCQDGLPIAESILLEFRDRLAHGQQTATPATEMALLWGAYLGEVVRIEHGDGHWQSTAGAPTSHSWIRFHGPGSRERFEPFAAAEAVLREQGPRTPLAMALGLRILDCHLE